MKRLMVILASICFAANIFASELIVKGNIDVPFSVYINGEKYYSYNSKVTVDYISSGKHKMEIYTEGASFELLYDCVIDIPRKSTVYATFTGDNKMYISSTKNSPEIVVELIPYPKRTYYSPAPKPVKTYHATPKKNSAPVAKTAPSKTSTTAKPATNSHTTTKATATNTSRPSSTTVKSTSTTTPKSTTTTATTKTAEPKKATARTTANTRK